MFISILNMYKTVDLKLWPGFVKNNDNLSKIASFFVNDKL